MGSVKFRTYHEVPGEDASGLLDQVFALRQRVQARLGRVNRLVAIASGKGGVGKSHVTALLALELRRLGKSVGVLDADLHGPTIAKLLEARGPLEIDEHEVQPATGREGILVFSTDLLLNDQQPLTWREIEPGGRVPSAECRVPSSENFLFRGPRESNVLRESLADVAWGDLDFLLVDLPPGTDRLEDLASLAPSLSGVLVVTLPTDESRRSVARAMHAAAASGVRLLGIVENMSGYACPTCGTTGPLFQGDAGAILASEFAVPLIAKIPFGRFPFPLSPFPLDQFLELLP